MFEYIMAMHNVNSLLAREVNQGRHIGSLNVSSKMHCAPPCSRKNTKACYAVNSIPKFVFSKARMAF